jgi:hypothetical protein
MFVFRKRPSLVTALWALVMTTGCTGSIPASNPSDAPDQPIGGSGKGPRAPSSHAGSSGGGADGAGGAIGACSSPTPARPPLRRLNPTEYANTVRDLFHADDLPAVTIPADQVIETEGFDNDAATQNPSPVLVESYQRAALLITESAFKSPGRFLPCTDAAATGCGSRIVAILGRRAFRRPLTAAEQQSYEAFLFTQQQDANLLVAAQLLAQALLQSPQFLYKPELAGGSQAGRVALDGYALATRLSYLLWESMPDDELLDAAGTGKLAMPDQLQAQARRLLADPRARTAIGRFHAQWLETYAIDAIEKDAKLFPAWSPALKEGLRLEAARSLERAVFDPGASLASLFTGAQTFATPALAAVYGAKVPAGAAGDWVDVDPARRSGFLTQAWWLASLAHPTETSPVKRGKFVMQKLLCSPPQPPSGDVNTAVPEVKAGDGKTVRARLVQQHEVKPSCATCHKIIDGIGFGFEHYDSLGRWQATDNGQPVDATGEVRIGSDVDGAFDGALELGRKLAGSQQVQRCVVQHWFRYALGRVETDADACAIADLEQRFEAAKHNVPEWLVSIVASDAFRYVSAP